MPTKRNPARARLLPLARPQRPKIARKTSAAKARSHAVTSRRQILIDEAARLFGVKGYESTSMRDIAAAIGILPGSLYHHFESKEELFVAVYSLGVSQILEAVTAAIARQDDPWGRLEAACVAHMQTLLVKDSYAAAVISHLSFNNMPKQDRLVGLRDRYESVFKGLIENLPLRAGVDRRIFRLGLLGSMNWAIVWYRPGGETPMRIARKLLDLLRTK
jgi:AcrR family transcriptional regulator